ncbi:hypothetical protein BS47DRAFT_113663 [Hydnum rufescens UP504]|uniref:Uncharacterized protein n=1 Tax=Hydnum rufescens UP504 TaxID=1448309 RepID=A0A9P6APU1_9AGAM|nr:hypothetical protein BS47DRAFT_113663 [Hydnum rufescens UP504]
MHMEPPTIESEKINPSWESGENTINPTNGYSVPAVAVAAPDIITSIRGSARSRQLHDLDRSLALLPSCTIQLTEICFQYPKPAWVSESGSDGRSSSSNVAAAVDIGERLFLWGPLSTSSHARGREGRGRGRGRGGHGPRGNRGPRRRGRGQFNKPGTGSGGPT